MTIPSTIIVTNNPPPNIDPIIRGIPSWDSPAENEEITSGAPFENATRVTPARVSDILSRSAILETAGLRCVSAVDPRR